MAWKKCLESKKHWNKKIEIRKERIDGSALTGAPFYGRENERMRYEEFLKEIMGMLETTLGKSYQLEYGDIRKNNGIRRKGLVIKEQGEVVSPVFYLEEAYQKVKDGMDPAEAVEEILLYAENGKEVREQIDEKLTDLEWVRSRIVWKLVHREKNKELLKDMPYLPFLDLAVTFCIYLGSNEDGIASARITKEIMELWGLTVSELERLAKDNTPELLPPMRFDVEQALEMVGGHKKSLKWQLPLTALSNEERYFGAGVILYPEVLETTSKEMGADLLLIPSSVHEFLALPDDHRIDYRKVLQIIETVNQTEVSEEEFLSDSLYRYCRAAKKVELVTITEEQNNGFEKEVEPRSASGTQIRTEACFVQNQ